MQDSSLPLEKIKTRISVLELKRMLVTIVDLQLPVCFRFRILGEMWQQNFMRVVKVTEKGVVLNDEISNKTHHVTDLSHIVQFEIDQRLHTFHPHFHYDLTVSQ
jgi:hypothetical protein